MSAKGAICPACQHPGSGRFCTECGTPLGGGRCRNCQAELSAGSKFCPKCGTSLEQVASTAAATPAASPEGSGKRWPVTGIALGALTLLVLFQAVRSGATATSAIPSEVVLPDISAMGPQERANRLYQRAMRLVAEGKSDSALFFSTMASQQYASMGPLDDALRYQFGRLAEIAGESAVVGAQADTILAKSPTHLLGLVLARRAARLSGDSAAVRSRERELLAAEQRELSRSLPEYAAHRSDIDAAITEARQRRQ